MPPVLHSWLLANWQTGAIVVALYLGLSLAKMPPPSNPWLYTAWWLLRAACCHTWDEWGGRWKWPLAPPMPFPLPPYAPPGAELPPLVYVSPPSRPPPPPGGS